MVATEGDRVIAILSYDDQAGKVYSFGSGTYEGKFPLPEWALGYNFGQENPKITLDNGDVVWGCECWWGSEECIKNLFPEDKYMWESVKVSNYRATGNITSE